MSKKTASFIALILLIVFAVFVFMPCIFEIVDLKQVPDIPHAYQEVGSTYENLFYVCGLAYANLSDVYAVISYVFVLIGIIALVLHIAGRENKIVTCLTFSSCIASIFFALVTVFFGSTYEPGDKWYYVFKAGWGFYILCALLLIASILSVLIALGKVNKVPPKTPISTQSISDPDILKKYKDLLESGAITQEEYEKIKARLLHI